MPFIVFSCKVMECTYQSCQIIFATIFLILHRFLLAKLLLDRLCRATTKIEFHRILEHSPRKISDTYSECLQRVTDQEEEADARLGNRVLKELLAADLPIRAEELLDAVADNAEWAAGDQTDVEERVKRCLKCCMHLIDRTEDGTIRFCHATVRKFLESHRFLRTMSSEATEKKKKKKT